MAIPLVLLKKLLPMKTLVLIGITLAVGLGGYFYGRHAEAVGHEIELREAVEFALTEERKLFDDDRKLTIEYYEELLTNNVRVEREIKEVIKYVESDAGNVECLNPDGVRLVNDIIKNDLSPTE